MKFSQKQKHVSMVCVWIWICITSSVYAASLLDPHEVTTLRAIAKELEKTDWNFAVDPCSNDTTWVTIVAPQTNPTYVNKLDCDCSGDVCHVVNIDLTRNYLSGPIPLEWASLDSLNFLSLIVNRLTGPIPTYLGNFTSLTYLSIESNMFNGHVPAELGRLVNLRNLTISANYLTGQLPKALTSLTNLIELRMSSNNFSGKMPNYFPSWTALQSLEIQGSGFSGPIPSTLANLTSLIDLVISDLPGEGSSFPNLRKMENLTNLNCKISGSIPNYLTELSNIKTLDLSFNNLIGTIPELSLQKIIFMYLTNNFLTGTIPNGMTLVDVGRFIDLSYNNLDGSSLSPSCSKNNLNLYRSFSRDLNSSLAPCLDVEYPCSHKRYSLHINCGGKRTKVGKSTWYEADDDIGGPTMFVPNKAEWGYSNTGHFWKWGYTVEYTATNVYDTVQPLKDADLYTNARKSALSLTYYGRCLATGNYTVVLHFAEIRFTNNNSFHSLGMRFFDVYVQEKLVRKNFDIVEEASGAERACNVTVNNVLVTKTGTVEIRFFYTGKGTTAAPIRGTYGPLISAISVHSEFSPPLGKKTIIEIVVGSSASLILLTTIACCTFLWWWRKKNLPSREEVLKGIDLQTSLFTYVQIKMATGNFNPANKIGEGGFGSVYRGTLLDGTYIAVKRLSTKSSQGNKEFVTEIGMMSGLHHPNLVRLYGCCVEGAQLFLVYEYMVNNNLARALFDEDWVLRLDWPTRQKVCIELARGLAFLHEDSTIKIIHRDVKPTNVLLDENLNAKISDFGLARLREEENTHISTRVAGTIGYMSPEYALWGYLTYKADVYSFGVVALEIVAGRSNMDFVPDEDNFCLLDCAAVEEKRGELLSMVDTKLGDEYNKEEAIRMIKIALLCTNASPALRPTMSQVVKMLEGNLSVEDAAACNYLPVRQRRREH